MKREAEAKWDPPNHPYPEIRALHALGLKFYALNQMGKLEVLMANYMRRHSEEFMADWRQERSTERQCITRLIADPALQIRTLLP